MTTDLLTDDSARVQKILDNKYAFGANFLPKKEECDEPFTTTSQCKSPFTTMKLSCCHDEDASEHDILVVRAGNDHEERMQIPVAEVLVDENRVTRTSDNRIRPQERDEQQQITLDRLCPGQPTVVPRVPATIEWKEGKQDVVLGDAAAAAKNFEEAEQEKKRAITRRGEMTRAKKNAEEKRYILIIQCIVKAAAHTYNNFPRKMNGSKYFIMKKAEFLKLVRTYLKQELYESQGGIAELLEKTDQGLIRLCLAAIKRMGNVVEVKCNRTNSERLFSAKFWTTPDRHHGLTSLGWQIMKAITGQ